MNKPYFTVTSPISARYWSELKDLSDSVKLELITLLSSSMVKTESEDNSDNWADRFCGVWKDSRSADDIVDDIRSMRTANHFGIEL